MSYKRFLKKSERWLLKRIAHNIVRQDWWHKERITGFFEILSDAAKNEFKEDTDISLFLFLEECLKRGFYGD